jgi:hypothetical protein
MIMPTTPAPYNGGRFPQEIIAHAVWRYFRFNLHYRDVEELLASRRIVVTYETIRQWCPRFGHHYANQVRRRRAQPGDTWHLDEVFLKINGKTPYLWRAMDQQGNVLDILVQSRRNKAAANKFFRTALNGCQYVPRVLIRTNSGVTWQPTRRSCPGSNTVAISVCTIGPNIPTNQRGNVSARCVALSPLARRNVSYPPLGRSATTSVHGAIGYEPRTTVGRVSTDSRPGTK